MKALFAVVGSLALSGCIVDTTEPDFETDSDVDTIAARCPAFGCGVNTATGPDGSFFDVLDWTGWAPNPGGVRIASFTQGATNLKLRVEGDRMVGYDSLGRRYTGDALDGAKMKMSTPTGSFEVWIYDVDTTGIRFWAGDREETVEVYDILVRPPKGQWANACNQPITGWSGRSHSAIAFHGDLYHPDKTVTDGTNTSWFNLACAGSYEAKLHLLRHTYAGGFNDAGWREFPTDLAQRQTYLRALTADYFGNGATHTVSGTPLRYTDAQALHPDVFTGTRLEALWDANGAICLENPRIGTRALIDPSGLIPSCVGGASRPAYVLTALPPPP